MSTAAAAQSRREEEEERMTPYMPRDLFENWEFKILRSATGAFKDPAVMQRYLADEAQVGLTLVEKFDNSRIRLKRAARQQDAQCTFDPYRTRVGISEVELGMLIAGSILGPRRAVHCYHRYHPPRQGVTGGTLSPRARPLVTREPKSITWITHGKQEARGVHLGRIGPVVLARRH
jgi:hypothetical protein